MTTAPLLRQIFLTPRAKKYVFKPHLSPCLSSLSYTPYLIADLHIGGPVGRHQILARCPLDSASHRRRKFASKSEARRQERSKVHLYVLCLHLFTHSSLRLFTQYVEHKRDSCDTPRSDPLNYALLLSVVVLYSAKPNSCVITHTAFGVRT